MAVVSTSIAAAALLAQLGSSYFGRKTRKRSTRRMQEAQRRAEQQRKKKQIELLKTQYSSTVNQQNLLGFTSKRRVSRRKPMGGI